MDHLRWLLAAALAIACGCAPDGLDTDEVADGSYATMAIIGQELAQHEGVVCVDGEIGHVFMDTLVPDMVSIRMVTTGVDRAGMKALGREAVERAWASEVRIGSVTVWVRDRGEDTSTTADDIVVSIEGVFPKFADTEVGASLDAEELTEVLGEREEDLGAVVGREAPEPSSSCALVGGM